MSSVLLKALTPSNVLGARHTTVASFLPTVALTALSTMMMPLGTLPTQTATTAFQALPTSYKAAREAFHAAHESSVEALTQKTHPSMTRVFLHQLAMASKFWHSLTEIEGTTANAARDALLYYNRSGRRDDAINATIMATLEGSTDSDEACVETLILLERYIYGAQRLNVSGPNRVQHLVGGVLVKDLIDDSKDNLPAVLCCSRSLPRTTPTSAEDLAVFDVPVIKRVGNFIVTTKEAAVGEGHKVIPGQQFYDTQLDCLKEPNGEIPFCAADGKLVNYTPIPYFLFRAMKPEGRAQLDGSKTFVVGHQKNPMRNGFWSRG